MQAKTTSNNAKERERDMRKEAGSGALGRLKASRRRGSGGTVGANSLGSLRHAGNAVNSEVNFRSKQSRCCHQWLEGEVAYVCSKCLMTIDKGNPLPEKGWHE